MNRPLSKTAAKRMAKHMYVERMRAAFAEAHAAAKEAYEIFYQKNYRPGQPLGMFGNAWIEPCLLSRKFKAVAYSEKYPDVKMGFGGYATCHTRDGITAALEAAAKVLERHFPEEKFFVKGWSD